MNKKTIYFVVAFFSVIVLFIWLYYARGRIQFGLSELYSARLEARDFGMPMILRYIFSSMKIVLPIFVVWALINKFIFLATIFSFVQLTAFFVDGSKATVFSLLVSFVCYFAIKGDTLRIKYMPLLASLLAFLSVLEYKINETFYISGLLIRRAMFVPQSLNIRYYDFFTSHSPDYFQASFLKSFGFESQYGSIARMIGYYYSGDTDLAANNGLFSDAYANLGSLGIIVMPLCIILLLKLMDAFSDNLPLELFIGAAVIFTVQLISATFFTLFLSHGAVALLLIFYFIPRVHLKKKNSIG